MSQALEESMRMYEEENRRAPPDASLEVSTVGLLCLFASVHTICLVAFSASCVMCSASYITKKRGFHFVLH